MVCFSLLTPHSRFWLSQIKSSAGIVRSSLISAPLSVASTKPFSVTVTVVAVISLITISLLLASFAVQPVIVTASPALKYSVRSTASPSSCHAIVMVLVVNVAPAPDKEAPSGFTVLVFRSRYT